MYLCYACNGAESHRSFVPFPHVSRRRVLRGVERGVGHRCPLRPRVATTLSLTRPPISPHPAQIPPSCTMCWVRDGSAGNAGRPSRGLTFSIIFMWWLATWKVYVVSPLCLVPLLFFFFTLSAFYIHLLSKIILHLAPITLCYKFVTHNYQSNEIARQKFEISERD